MKKNIYECPKCDHKIHTERRDPGTTPTKIGCVNPDICSGMMNSHLEMVDQNSDVVPDYIFFKPKTKEEWKMIDRELVSEIVRDHKSWSGSKIQRKKNQFMTRIQRTIRNGGLCYLPRTFLLTD